MAPPAKAVLDIEINDAPIKAFRAELEKLKKVAASLPAPFAKTPEMQTVLTNMQKLTAEYGRQHRALREVQHVHKEVNKHVEEHVGFWAKLVGHAKEYTRIVAGASSPIKGAVSATAGGDVLSGVTKMVELMGPLGKVAGIALAAAGATYAATAFLARGATAERMSSFRQGLAPGELKSMDVNLGAYFDMPGLTKSINAARSDATSAGAIGLQALTGGPVGKGASGSIGALRALKSRMAGIPEGMWGPYLQAMGLSGVFSTDDVRMTQETPEGELEKQFAKTHKDVGEFAKDEKSARRWQEADESVAHMTEFINTKLINNFTSLADTLRATNETIEHPLDALGAAATAAANALDELAKKIIPAADIKAAGENTPGAQQRATAAEATGAPAPYGGNQGVATPSEVGGALRDWGKSFIHPGQGYTPPPMYQSGSGRIGQDGLAYLHEGERVLRPGETDDANRILNAIRTAESGGNYGAGGGNVPGQGRAIGAYQFMPATLRNLSQQLLGRVVDPDEFRRNPMLQDQLARMQVQRLLSQGYDARDIFAIWHSGQPYSKSFGWNDPTAGLTVQQSVARKMALMNGTSPDTGYFPQPAMVNPMPRIEIQDRTGGSINLISLAAGHATPFPI